MNSWNFQSKFTFQVTLKHFGKFTVATIPISSRVLLSQITGKTTLAVNLARLFSCPVTRSMFSRLWKVVRWKCLKIWVAATSCTFKIRSPVSAQHASRRPLAYLKSSWKQVRNPKVSSTTYYLWRTCYYTTMSKTAFCMTWKAAEGIVSFQTKNQAKLPLTTITCKTWSRSPSLFSTAWNGSWVSQFRTIAYISRNIRLSTTVCL